MDERIRKLAAPLLPAVRWVRDRKSRRETQQWLQSIAGPFGGYEGKVILDVGTDLHGNTVQAIDRSFSPKEVVGVNLAAEDRQVSPRGRLQRADVRHLPYSDETFDLIISSSAFEHITGIEEALAEMHRVLRPGGYLFSHFGPIWSTSYGHHLWLTHGGRLHTYWNLVLPPYCHLLMTAGEIEALLRERGHDAELSRVVSEYATSSGEQNQLFFEDYEEIFTRSAFEVLLFKGYDYPELARVYNAQLTPEVLDGLRARHPGRRHFFYDGITTLMRRR